MGITLRVIFIVYLGKMYGHFPLVPMQSSFPGFLVYFLHYPYRISRKYMTVEGGQDALPGAKIWILTYILPQKW